MRWLASSLLLLLVSGCAGVNLLEPASSRRFDFQRDTFAYANQLVWEYRTDPATGRLAVHQNLPRPAFVHRCFAVSRMARQFFQYARFDPAGRKLDHEAYRQAIAAVLARRPADARRDGGVPIPGYADLRSFSRDQETLLKDASGGPLGSYFQFSNWRMVFPFSRGHQQATATQLLQEVRANRLAIVHLIRFSTFPVTKIDHAMVIFSAVESTAELRFQVYDPNDAEHPGELSYERASRTFIFPATPYFDDGPVDVYEIDSGDIT